MKIPDFINQYNKLQEKELERRVWEMWLAKYPHMTEDTFISYNEMLNTAKRQELTQDKEVVDGVYADQVFL